MHEIPDKIKEFWEKQGYVVKPRFSLQPEPKHSCLWDACTKEDRIKGIEERIVYTIGLTFHEREELSTVYYWESSSYSEDEILRIYKLKAFL